MLTEVNTRLNNTAATPAPIWGPETGLRLDPQDASCSFYPAIRVELPIRDDSTCFVGQPYSCERLSIAEAVGEGTDPPTLRRECLSLYRPGIWRDLNGKRVFTTRSDDAKIAGREGSHC